MRRWLKIGSGIAVAVTTIIGLFILLQTNFGFQITDLTGDIICNGTYEAPCISEFNVKNPTKYDVDIYSKDQVKLDFSPQIYDYALFVVDGRCSATGSCACKLKDGKIIGFKGWRCVDFTNATKSQTVLVYNFRFPKYSTTKFRLIGIKNNPIETIKWGFGVNESYLDPFWYGINGTANIPTTELYAELGSQINITTNISGVSSVCVNINHPDYGNNYACGTPSANFLINITYFRNSLFNDSLASKNISWSNKILNRDYTPKSCGNDCSGGDYTYPSSASCTNYILADSCAGSASCSYDAVTDIWLNGTSFTQGDLVNATMQVMCETTGTDIRLLYYNGSSWTAIVNESICNVVPSGTANYSTVFQINSVIETQYLRGQVAFWNGVISDECYTGLYGDNDDINFTITSTSTNGGNQTIYIKQHRYDEIINASVNVTGFITNGTYPTNIKIWINNSLSNDIGIISDKNTTINKFIELTNVSSLNQESIIGTNSSGVCSSSYPCSNAYDRNWDNYAFSNGADVSIDINYTIPLSPSSANITYGIPSLGGCPACPGLVMIYCLDGGTPTLITTKASTGMFTNSIPSGCYDNENKLIMRFVLRYLGSYNSQLAETNLTWYLNQSYYYEFSEANTLIAGINLKKQASITDAYFNITGFSKEYFDQQATSSSYSYTGGNGVALFQTFTPSVSNISRIYINLVKNSSASSNIPLRIGTTPNASDIFSTNIDITKIPLNQYPDYNNLVEIPITYLSLNISKTYWISVNAEASKGVFWRGSANNTNLYLRGTGGSYDSSDHNITLDFAFKTYVISYPTNSYIEIGVPDGIKEWNWTGEFTSKVKANLNVTVFNNYLTNCTADSNNYCNIPIYFVSSTGGYLAVDNININYTYNPNPVYLNTDLISSFLGNSSGFANIPIKIDSSQNGTLQISDVRLDYRGGNNTINILTYGGGFNDSFNRANNDELGANWTKSYDNTDVGVNASVLDNKLLIQDASASNNIRIAVNNTNINYSYSQLDMRFMAQGVNKATSTDGMVLIILNENLAWIHQVKINDTSVRIGGTVLQGTNEQTLTTGTFYNLTFVFDWTSNKTQISLDNNNFGNLSFQNNALRFGWIEFNTAAATVLGNLSVDFINLGFSDNLNLNVFYSNWGFNFPKYINYLEFIPTTSTSKNVSAYGQTNSIPIFNLTTYNYGGRNMNLSIYLNETHSCVNLTASITSNKSDGFLLNNTWKNLEVNLEYLNNSKLWLWADYSCNYTAWRLWKPDISIRGCCSNCICSEET